MRDTSQHISNHAVRRATRPGAAHERIAALTSVAVDSTLRTARATGLVPVATAAQLEHQPTEHTRYPEVNTMAASTTGTPTFDAAALVASLPPDHRVDLVAELLAVEMGEAYANAYEDRTPAITAHATGCRDRLRAYLAAHQPRFVAADRWADYLHAE